MAQTVCDLDDNLDDNLAKPANVESILHYYAVTMKPNMAIEQNNVDMLELVFDDRFGDYVTNYPKYELDSRSVLHKHFTLVVPYKLKSYYPFKRKGWMIHLKKLKDTSAVFKWRHYLTKGEPDEQVLLMAQAQTQYMFQ